MAASQVAQWTVVIVCEKDERLNGTYRMSPNTPLVEVLQVWRDDFALFGHCLFKSANEEVTYRDDRKMLKEIGETLPRMIYLRAELSDEPTPRPTRELFVYTKDKCHHVLVKPHEKLYEVAGRVPGRLARLEFNGLPLNLNDTVQQAGLRNESVIYESLCSVSVKLSSGVTVAVKLPSNSLVHHLKEKVNFYENDEFSLWHQGRCLGSDENITQLRNVKVTTAEFKVHVDGRHVSWRTSGAPIPVSQFVSQLAVNGNINTKELETLEFVCVGCQRRIINDDNSTQHLPVNCCKESSLTLHAKASSNSGTNAEPSDLSKNIQSYHCHLAQCRLKDSRTAATRFVCREMKKRFDEGRLDYNILTRCGDSLLRKTNDVEDEVKRLEVIIETLKIKVTELEEEMEGLETRHVKSIDEIKKLLDNNKTLQEQSWKPGDELKQFRVTLLIIYWSRFFSPASCPEVQFKGQWPFDTSFSYIKCEVPGICPGSRSFEEVQDILQRLFTRGKIAAMGQWRGIVAGREVTRVTSLRDEVARKDKSPYCGVDGTQHSWEEAGKPECRSFFQDATSSLAADGEGQSCGSNDSYNCAVNCRCSSRRRRGKTRARRRYRR